MKLHHNGSATERKVLKLVTESEFNVNFWCEMLGVFELYCSLQSKIPKPSLISDFHLISLISPLTICIKTLPNYWRKKGWKFLLLSTPNSLACDSAKWNVWVENRSVFILDFGRIKLGIVCGDWLILQCSLIQVFYHINSHRWY